MSSPAVLAKQLFCSLGYRVFNLVVSGASSSVSDDAGDRTLVIHVI